MLANKISDSAKKNFVLDDHKNGNNPDCDGTVAFTRWHSHMTPHRKYVIMAV